MQIIRKHIKYLRIKIDRDGKLIISAPRLMPQRQIDNFLEKKKGWIISTQKKILSQQQLYSIWADHILLYGNIYTYQKDKNLTNKIIVDTNTFIITSDLDLTNHTIQTKRLKEYAKEVLTIQLQVLSQKHNTSFNKIIIRDQKTKRGTCSSQKNIGLNRKLIKMPTTIAEYIICHELAHLKEMNHSTRFWAYLDTLYPERKQAEQWLKDNRMTV